ncbi:T9SS type A sorting domain-containing protein [Crocinitomix sp.]|nr:T9SS type A sorting domain-containing protein [Crocinitomix sp.]
MKKIYTLIAILAFTFGATAQDDFAVNLVSHTEGDTDDSDPMDFEFEVENVGSTTYGDGDTLVVSLAIDGAIVSLELAGGYVSFLFLTEDFAPGDIYSVPVVAGIDWLDQPVPTTVSLCAVVYGMGVESFSGGGPSVEEYIVNDDDVSNNTSCISVILPVAVDDSGIEDLGLTLSNVYVSGNQLMLENEGINGEALVNLSIVNMNGQTVQTNNFVMVQGTSALAINSLAPGIYVVAIEVEGQIATRKISIQ